MDEIPGWILRAIAGNGHDVDWSGRYCAYAIETVSTTLYPVEAIEEFAASGLLVNAFVQYGINDSHLVVSSGIQEIIVYGEAFGYDQSSVGVTTSVEGVSIFGTQIWLDPDEASIQQVPTGGEIIDGVYFTVVESFEARATVIEATLA